MFKNNNKTFLSETLYGYFWTEYYHPNNGIMFKISLIFS